jgi:predicted acyltransferase
LFKVWVLQGWMLGTINLQDGAVAALSSQLGTEMGGWIYMLGLVLLAWLVLWWFGCKKWILKL